MPTSGPRLTLAMVESFESNPVSVTSLVQEELNLLSGDVGFDHKYVESLQDIARVPLFE